MDGVETHLYDVMNYPGMFRHGQRLRNYNSKDILSLSGRLISEFSGRRNIRDMFTKKGPLPGSVVVAKAGTLVDPSASENYNSAPVNTMSNTEGSAVLPAEDGTTTYFEMESGSSTEVKNLIGKFSKVKRIMSEVSDGRTPKRAKSSLTLTTPPNRYRGQQSLKGFFKPASSSMISARELHLDSGSPLSKLDDDHGNVIPQNIEHSTGDKEEWVNDANDVLVKSAPPKILESTFQEQDRVHDPVESKESWSKLFTKPVRPRCESHDEPCKMMVTKKPGINCGRSFWVCAKPLGPSGVKEKGTQWRCGTFIWCSDWIST